MLQSCIRLAWNSPPPHFSPPPYRQLIRNITNKPGRVNAWSKPSFNAAEWWVLGPLTCLVWLTQTDPRSVIIFLSRRCVKTTGRPGWPTMLSCYGSFWTIWFFLLRTRPDLSLWETIKHICQVLRKPGRRYFDNCGKITYFLLHHIQYFKNFKKIVNSDLLIHLLGNKQKYSCVTWTSC